MGTCSCAYYFLPRRNRGICARISWRIVDLWRDPSPEDTSEWTSCAEYFLIRRKFKFQSTVWMSCTTFCINLFEIWRETRTKLFEMIEYDWYSTCPGKNEMSTQCTMDITETSETMKYQNHRKRKIFSLNILIMSTHWTVWWWMFPSTRTWTRIFLFTSILLKE